MTPLAQMLTRKWLATGSPDTTNKGLDLLWPSIVSDMHCFECSDVADLAAKLSDDIRKVRTVDERSAFLPFPVTLIEYDLAGEMEYWELPKKGMFHRIAYLCVQSPKARDECFVFTIAYYRDTDRYKAAPGFIRLPLLNNPQRGQSYGASEQALERAPDPKKGEDGMAHVVLLTYAMLAIINSPKVVDRDRMPAHRGVVKEANRRARQAGTPPQTLQDWHKIRLSMHVPSEHGGGTDRVTGKRALHWVRMFPRIRRGRLEWVSAHQRGSAEVGIARAIYEVKK